MTSVATVPCQWTTPEVVALHDQSERLFVDGIHARRGSTGLGVVMFTPEATAIVGLRCSSFSTLRTREREHRSQHADAGDH